MMSEPFPSKAYRELCTQPKVADRLREEWEPRVGDWVVLKHQPSKPYLIVLTYPALLISLGAVSEGVLKNQCIPLFQPRQIIEMLGERGYNIEQSIYTDNSTSITVYQKCVAFWHGDDTWRCWECGSYVRYTAKGCIQVGWHDREGQPCPHLVEAEGPALATALLRAWLEVVKEEK